MRKLTAIFAACFILVGLVGVGISADPEEAEAAVIYNYICFEMDGWPYAGGSSSNPRSAADSCYRALGQKAALRFGYQCPYSGFSHTNYATGQFHVGYGDGFWNSIMCPWNDPIQYGTGTFYS